MTGCFRPLANQFVVGKAFASESSRRFHKPISISSFASIESKSLFVQVSEKVKRFYRNVSASDRPFEKRPKVFNSVSVNLSVNVLFRVVNYIVNVVLAKRTVRAQRVSVDHRTLLNMLMNFTLKMVAFITLISNINLRRSS